MMQRNQQRDRIGRTFIAVFFLVVFGFFLILILRTECGKLFLEECVFLWGTATSAVLGGVLTAEMIFRRQIRQAKQGFNKESKEPPRTTWRMIFLRSALPVVLTSLLVSAPVIVRGSFIIAGLGFGFGFFIPGLFRGIADRLPPHQ